MSLVGDDGHRTGRRAGIQGLRAVAVGLVVAFHAGLPVSGGFIGVDMFFVISGFVITAMLLRQLQVTARLKFGSS
jgi:peptidoglycan/LPS O-acetylase OafA/YrhL